MKLSENKSLHQIIALVFLLTTFWVQASTAFACELAAASIQADQCCQEHAADECATGNTGTCIASIDNVQPTDTFITKSIESPFLPAPFSNALLSPLEKQPHFLPGILSSWSAGSDIYLKTQRFRE